MLVHRIPRERWKHINFFLQSAKLRRLMSYSTSSICQPLQASKLTPSENARWWVTEAILKTLQNTFQGSGSLHVLQSQHFQSSVFQTIRGSRKKLDYIVPTRSLSPLLIQYDLIGTSEENIIMQELQEKFAETAVYPVVDDHGVSVFSHAGYHSNQREFQFKLNPPILAALVLDANASFLSQPDVSVDAPRTVLEFSSPNIAKPFHAGHLRSTLIGNCLSRLCAAKGHQVTRVNYMGDWGRQFAILSAGLEQRAKMKLKNTDDKVTTFEINKHITHEKAVSSYIKDELQHAQNPLRILLEVYVQANQEVEDSPEFAELVKVHLSSLERREGEIFEIWQFVKTLSQDAYTQIYKQLSIEFDEVCFESDFVDDTKEVVASLQNMGNLIQAENGAKIVNLSEDLGQVVITKGGEVSTYLVRDVAAALKRKDNLNFDQMLYIVGHTQRLHFKQLFFLLKSLGHGSWSENCHHIEFGQVEGMSTRKGNIILLQDLLNEAQHRMLDLMKRNAAKYCQLDDPLHTASVLGLSAIVVQDLKSRRIKNYKFDWDQILQAEGDTGPFLQYTHARLCSIERTLGDSLLSVRPNPELISDNTTANNLVDSIIRFEDAVNDSLRKMEPAMLVNYLLTHARCASKAVASLKVKPIIQKDPELAASRLSLFSAARKVLGEGLDILGLEPLSKV
eukprot:m.60352 g.60352  ORF g.60352 m.60352 type:complete len:678 (-) comp11313_c0_seq3:1835-3868(-)